MSVATLFSIVSQAGAELNINPNGTAESIIRQLELGEPPERWNNLLIAQVAYREALKKIRGD